MPKNLTEKRKHSIIKKTVKWLDDYFVGKKLKFQACHYFPIGGEFRQHVWKILIDIPYGRLMNYGEIAKEVARCLEKDTCLITKV